VVLVVDDNEEIRELLGLWLKTRDCRVVEASDGAEAVEVARRERPDLIFMDLHLPQFDGFSAAYRIRLYGGAGSRVPIIAISADGELGGVVQQPVPGRDVGFTDFAPKPFSPGQLDQILDRYLPRAGETAAVE